MNIFCTDSDPERAAHNLDDKRVVKMIVESCQMLSTNLRYCGVDDDRIMRPAFVNHPCTKWARETRSNYDWLLAHTCSLLKVYNLRYSNIHKCSSLVKVFLEHRLRVPKGNLTTFANCTPYDIPDVISAYRKYMVYKWRIKDVRPVRFTNGSKPEWYDEWLPIIQREHNINLTGG